MPQPFLELVDISKTYPGVVALDHVGLKVAPGEVIALIGENGAGKSTLMRVLGGVVEPSGGLIRVDGVERGSFTVAEAIQAGIAFVHQGSTSSTISTSPATSSSGVSRCMAGRSG